MLKRIGSWLSSNRLTGEGGQVITVVAGTGTDVIILADAASGLLLTDGSSFLKRAGT